VNRENDRRTEDQEPIIIVTCLDEKGRTVVSHGVGVLSLKGHVLPNELFSSFPKRWDDTIGEWVAT
jgi:hypothetical protein